MVLGHFCSAKEAPDLRTPKSSKPWTQALWNEITVRDAVSLKTREVSKYTITCNGWWRAVIHKSFSLNESGGSEKSKAWFDSLSLVSASFISSLSCGCRGLNPLKLSLWGIFPLQLKQEMPEVSERPDFWEFSSPGCRSHRLKCVGYYSEENNAKLWEFTQINPFQNSLLLIFGFQLETICCKFCIFQPFVPIFSFKYILVLIRKQFLLNNLKSILPLHQCIIGH